MKEKYITNLRGNLTILAMVSLLAGVLLGGLPTPALAGSVYAALPYDLNGAGSTKPHIVLLVKDNFNTSIYHNITTQSGNGFHWSTFPSMKYINYTWLFGENNYNGMKEKVHMAEFSWDGQNITWYGIATTWAGDMHPFMSVNFQAEQKHGSPIAFKSQILVHWFSY